MKKQITYKGQKYVLAETLYETADPEYFDGLKEVSKTDLSKMGFCLCDSKVMTSNSGVLVLLHDGKAIPIRMD